MGRGEEEGEERVDWRHHVIDSTSFTGSQTKSFDREVIIYIKGK